MAELLVLLIWRLAIATLMVYLVIGAALLHLVVLPFVWLEKFIRR